jgi:hypothetical protein
MKRARTILPPPLKPPQAPSQGTCHHQISLLHLTHHIVFQLAVTMVWLTCLYHYQLAAFHVHNVPGNSLGSPKQGTEERSSISGLQDLTFVTSYHVRTYQHAHHCPVAGCRWSYQLLKDLLRHSAIHNTPEERDRYPCPVSGCSDTVSRQDLIKRHIERFH